MAARLTLLCSGATAAHRRAAFPLDEPLDEGEAAKAAKRGGLKAPDRVLISPALRARQTFEALGLAPEPAIDPALDDWNAGCWAGRTLAEIGKSEPDALQAWMTDPAAAPHGGESLLGLLARVGRWLEERTEERGSVLAVSHPALLRAALMHVVGAPPESFWRIDAPPLSRIDLSSDGRRWNLRLGG